ncbi:dystrophin isoform X2 [Patella vulgata]|uniref:dystrophin isoform X2 n=1 Tax=Patella vulgata TaxID=6465 RepID=UPI0024A7F765|nr:dystrophin isoform X2 [Patella vulgata]
MFKVKSVKMDVDDLYYYDIIMDGWEKKHTEEAIPFYVDHKSEKSIWDHPYLLKIFEELVPMVRLTVLRSVLEDHGYNHGSLLNIDCEQLTILLRDIYQTSDHRHFDTVKMEKFVDVTLNFLLGLYDTTRRGFMKISSVKTVLVTLCSARLSDKYRFFYSEIRDPSTFVSEDNLAPFINDLIQLPDMLIESEAFGKNVSAVVNSCYKSTSSNTGVSEDMFYRWLLMEPQTLVWLPTLHRVAATETVKHEAKCNICKSYPIVGFRYRCLKCFNFDMCQTCFFTGQVRGRHKLKHPIEEYCLMSALKDDTKAFLKTVRNNLSKKHQRKSEIKYLPVEGSQEMGVRSWEQRSVPDVSRLSSDISQQSLLSTAIIHSPTSQPILKLNQADFAVHATQPCHINTDIQVTVASNNNSNTDLLQKQRQELETVIKQLDEEKRKLYIQLAELKVEDQQKQSSDTESIISVDLTLQHENNLMKAKKEVADDHNTRLRHQLDRVQKVLKENPHNYQEDDYLWKNTCLDKYKIQNCSMCQSQLETGDEDPEIRDLLQRIDDVFPKDMSYSATCDSSISKSFHNHNEMLEAANGVGEAMSTFVQLTVDDYYSD